MCARKELEKKIKYLLPMEFYWKIDVSAYDTPQALPICLIDSFRLYESFEDTTLYDIWSRVIGRWKRVDFVHWIIVPISRSFHWCRRFLYTFWIRKVGFISRVIAGYFRVLFSFSSVAIIFESVLYFLNIFYFNRSIKLKRTFLLLFLLLLLLLFLLFNVADLSFVVLHRLGKYNRFGLLGPFGALQIIL